LVFSLLVVVDKPTVVVRAADIRVRGQFRDGFVFFGRQAVEFLAED
jgi:hypothetical protein